LEDDMQQHTDVYDSKGQLLLTTLGIDTDMWDELYPSWHIAIVFVRVTSENTTARLEWNNISAMIERGNPVRYLR
jgi:hypothetical protein